MTRVEGNIPLKKHLWCSILCWVSLLVKGISWVRRRGQGVLGGARRGAGRLCGGVRAGWVAKLSPRQKLSNLRKLDYSLSTLIILPTLHLDTGRQPNIFIWHLVWKYCEHFSNIYSVFVVRWFSGFLLIIGSATISSVDSSLNNSHPIPKGKNIKTQIECFSFYSREKIFLNKQMSILI